MNSQEEWIKPLKSKEKLNTPMNTIMSISIGLTVPATKDNNSFALTALGKQTGFIIGISTVACLFRKTQLLALIAL